MRRLNRMVCPTPEFLKATRDHTRRAVYALMSQYAPLLAERQIFIDDKVFHVEDAVLTTQAHRAHVPETQAVFIDYFQQLGMRKRFRDRREEYDAGIRALSQMRKTLGRPLFVLSQLARGEYGMQHGPALAALKETSTLEQEADVVIFLWEGDNDRWDGTVNCSVRKHRDGRTGEIKGGLRFIPPQQLVCSHSGKALETDEQEDLF